MTFFLYASESTSLTGKSMTFTVESTLWDLSIRLRTRKKNIEVHNMATTLPHKVKTTRHTSSTQNPIVGLLHSLAFSVDFDLSTCFDSTGLAPYDETSDEQVGVEVVAVEDEFGEAHRLESASGGLSGVGFTFAAFEAFMIFSDTMLLLVWNDFCRAFLLLNFFTCG